jgi:hypothetical protein
VADHPSFIRLATGRPQGVTAKLWRQLPVVMTPSNSKTGLGTSWPWLSVKVIMQIQLEPAPTSAIFGPPLSQVALAAPCKAPGPCRVPLRDKHITAVIPQPRDQITNRKRRGRRGGRPPGFDPAAYKLLNLVERGFNRRKHWRGLATRYDKLGAHFQAALDLVEMLDWLRAVPDRRDLRDRT